MTVNPRAAAKATQIGMLTSVGVALYGEMWQRALARDLELYERTMRRWIVGEGIPDPDTLAERLRPIVVRHRDTLQRLARDLGA